MNSHCRKEIDAIVRMSPQEWTRAIAALEAVERAAYGNYHGVSPARYHQIGTPQRAGLGSLAGGFRGQEAWLAAKDAVRFARRVREGGREAWYYTPTADPGVVRYTYRFGGTDLRGWNGMKSGTHAVDVVTHGVDVADCDSPATAIAKIQLHASSHKPA